MRKTWRRKGERGGEWGSILGRLEEGEVGKGGGGEGGFLISIRLSANQSRILAARVHYYCFIIFLHSGA